MQTPDRPSHGNAFDGGAPYEWLDEWLCEYVDGTMDPSLETVFEQYVEADPELKAHVERLQQTRELLRGCDASDAPRVPTPPDRPDVEDGLFGASTPLPAGLSSDARGPLGTGASLVSSVAVALVVGFLAGSFFVDPTRRAPAPDSAHASAPTSARSEAPSRRPVRSREAQSPTEAAAPALVLRPATAPVPDTTTPRPVVTVGEP
jgi:anti-sigma factor RsiW